VRDRNYRPINAKQGFSHQLRKGDSLAEFCLVEQYLAHGGRGGAQLMFVAMGNVVLQNVEERRKSLLSHYQQIVSRMLE